MRSPLLPQRAANGTHQVCQCCECLRTLGILQVSQGSSQTTVILGIKTCLKAYVRSTIQLESRQHDDGYFSAFNTEPGLECCVCYMSSNVVLITALVEVEHEWILFLAERCFPYMIKYLCHQEAALILEKYSEILNQCVKSRGQSHTVQALQRTCAAAKDLIGIRSLGIGINREQHEVQQLAAACLRKAGKAKCTQ